MAPRALALGLRPVLNQTGNQLVAAFLYPALSHPYLTSIDEPYYAVILILKHCNESLPPSLQPHGRKSSPAPSASSSRPYTSFEVYRRVMDDSRFQPRPPRMPVNRNSDKTCPACRAHPSDPQPSDPLGPSSQHQSPSVSRGR